MLEKKEVFQLLKIALNKYLASLQNSSFDFMGFGEEAKAYMRVLDDDEFKCKFLNKDRAKEFLMKIEKYIL